MRTAIGFFRGSAVELSLWRRRFEEHLVLRQVAASTRVGYVAELAPFFAFLEAQGLTSLGEVTRSVVEDYRTHLFYATNVGTDPRKREERLRPSTQSNRLAAVKAFLRFLSADGYLVADPGAGVALPRQTRDLPRALLTEEETERLLEGPDVGTPLGLRDRAILEVLYGTGIRNGELVALQLDAVDLARQELRIHRGKGGKSRVVPLGEEAQAWLEVYLERARPRLLGKRPDSSAVFLSWRGHPLGRSAVCALVLGALQAAGLAKKITPHGLRHGCATHMLRHGAGLRHLQALLGHEQVNTTQRYLKVEVTDLREVMNRCHPRERDAEELEP